MRNPDSTDKKIKFIRLTVRGIVQGVGFRPFLHRLAKQHSIQGWVRNTSSGLEGVLEGTPLSLENFLADLQNCPPPVSSIEAVLTREAVSDESGHPYTGFNGFSILESQTDDGFTLVSPDIAMCPRCEAELYTKTDRRYRYPFINCTDCGPRYTIIDSLPYDRPRTTMGEFKMCRKCSREYHDILDRRYHAQPNCCPDCGPRIFFTAGSKHENDTEKALQSSQELLAQGGILAVKGIGGIHLACSALNTAAVNRLRKRKCRAEKPLAVMCRSLEAARRICRIIPEEERLLTSLARPIVLLKKKEPDSLSALSFGSRLGVMLPYSPLHTLLLDGQYGGPDILVMTSGNQSGCPVFTDNIPALEGLSGIADAFLLHNRRIRNRCDDSLVSEWKGQPYFLRRSRGYAPRPLTLRSPVPDGPSGNIRPESDGDGIFAMGAEQKASFALGKGTHIFLSPYIGDLKNAETLQHYTDAMKTYEKLFRLKPSLYVCDLHPDYLSGQEALRASQKAGLPLLKVQHHWAHMAACMADNDLDSPCFGIIWDGTGLGTDGTIWGGEFLTGDLRAFTRVGSIRPVPLPGGDKAILEIGRIALALARDAEIRDDSRIPLSEEKIRVLRQLLTLGQAPSASSIGRLFDGVCALLSGRERMDYEGQGAAFVEALSPFETAEDSGKDPIAFLRETCWPLTFYEKDDLRIFDTRPLVSNIFKALKDNENRGQIALGFMSSLACMALEQCIALNPGRLPVVLSGGVFQNRFLLHGVTALLENAGFPVYTHHRVSANDEGLCLGQFAIARKQRSMNHVSGNTNENQ